MVDLKFNVPQNPIREMSFDFASITSSATAAAVSATAKVKNFRAKPDRIKEEFASGESSTFEEPPCNKSKKKTSTRTRPETMSSSRYHKILIELGKFLRSVLLGVWYSRHHLIHSYVIIPFGIIVILSILYGLNQLLTQVFHIEFPSSVLGLLINLVWLCLLSLVADLKHSPHEHKVKTLLRLGANWTLTNYLTIIKPSMNFTLKWINVFFIPSFIILPLSDPITFIECLKIAGVFLGGIVIMILIDIYFIAFLKFAYGKLGVFKEEKEYVEKEEQFELELESMERSRKGNNGGGSGAGSNVFTSMRDDITTIDVNSLKSVKSVQTAPAALTATTLLNENPFESNVQLPEPEPLYHKVHHVEGTVGHPLQPHKTTPYPPKKHTSSSSASPSSASASSSSSSPSNSSSSSSSSSPSSSSAASPSDNSAVSSSITYNQLAQHKIPTTELPPVTVFITQYIDWVLYISLFLISLPFYYISPIHTFLPYHLGITVIAYFIALLIPQHYPQTRKFAHPILISTAIILFVCFIGSLIYHHHPRGFLEDLKFYKTGKNYLKLFNGQTMNNNSKSTTPPSSDFTSTPQWPGCGDFLSSLMDVSIVALSLPMFTHRRDFVKNFWILMPTILVSVGVTFFTYPIFCHTIGIQAERSIGFIGRSITLALGTPLMGSLGGSVSLMAVCTILSGIIGVLINDPLFKLFRVPKQDYLTRGVTLGINCGAIATAHLLNVDPRAASMSSLSFSVYGTVMIIMAAIGGVRDLIHSWVGLA
ncbi:uncharacterized protein LODBEIA_P34260 [Lodderomyces beijingensis]|uniref:LrgB-like protein n=1 Tax=Lodderomyces beijingensis TaxID=1775926 RepID=A0ABP0ZPD4_9ASCO